MIMRREKRPAAKHIVQIFHGRPSDRQAVERRSAATNLIKDDQRPRRSLIENCGGLHHFDHERGAAARQIVRSADP